MKYPPQTSGTHLGAVLRALETESLYPDERPPPLDTFPSREPRGERTGRQNRHRERPRHRQGCRRRMLGLRQVRRLELAGWRVVNVAFDTSHKVFAAGMALATVAGSRTPSPAVPPSMRHQPWLVFVRLAGLASLSGQILNSLGRGVGVLPPASREESEARQRRIRAASRLIQVPTSDAKPVPR